MCNFFLQISVIRLAVMAATVQLVTAPAHQAGAETAVKQVSGHTFSIRSGPLFPHNELYLAPDLASLRSVRLNLNGLQFDLKIVQNLLGARE